MRNDVSNWVMVSIWLEWTICFHCLNLFLKNLQSQRHHQNEILISHVQILPKGSNLRHKKEIWNFRSNNFYISTLVDRYLRTGNFLKNILTCQSGTEQVLDIIDTLFESPIIGFLEFGKRMGMTPSYELPRPLE